MSNLDKLLNNYAELEVLAEIYPDKLYEMAMEC